jgi:heme-degrading monooxygenase HmoA
MNIYLTNGTYLFMKKLKEDHSDQNLTLMQNAESTLLVHETEGKSVFQQPRKYEVIDGNGALKQGGFAVFNNIPVTDEGRPVFEYRFKNRARMIESVPGFLSIRVLRPMDTDTYVIMTIWENENAFHGWKNSSEYENAHAKRGTSEGTDNQKNIFARESYVTQYNVPNEIN